MKTRKNRWLSVLAAALSLMILSACTPSGNGNGNGQGEQDVHTYTDYNPETQSPYIVADQAKPDLMWDTQTLFATVPQIRDKNVVSLGENITSFMFAAAPYSAKDITREKTWVFAAMGKPDAEKYPMPTQGYPAVVLVHGGAGQVFPEWIKYWTDKGYVALALDMFGNQIDVNGNKAVNAYGGPDESKAGSLFDNPSDTANSWVYHSVYNVIMCHNILRNHSTVDERQIGITGISWGGVVTNIVSGVDNVLRHLRPCTAQAIFTTTASGIMARSAAKIRTLGLRRTTRRPILRTA